MGPTDAQLTIWRRFANLHPAAARVINAEARKINAHNSQTARTMSHGLAGRYTRWNWASVLRNNIANDYTPEELWASIARELARTSS